MITRSATISPCGRYRYTLERGWSSNLPLTFVMLNPSTADASEDDPTIRRCIAFARRENAGGIVVVNLFALRATEPRVLQSVEDPFGSDNHMVLDGVLAARNRIVCAWGAQPIAYEPSVVFRRLASVKGVQLSCLGRTMGGYPRHPLYLRADQPLEVFE